MKQIPADRLQEQAVLVGVELSSAPDHASLDESLQELERLAATDGAKIVGRFSQRLKTINPRTLIGVGKVCEIQQSIAEIKPDVVIFDEELSPAQQRNLEGAFKLRVVDRSQLILDIFAQRARSNEGKLQVELAQLEYLLPRLTRRWLHLSRLGGGIGTRGPGETQLEVDRRRLRERIATLRKRLLKVEKTRSIQRRKREEVPYATVALVGYTNSGKSTLMNALTRAGVLVEDRLFATLDPKIRCLRLTAGDKVMLVDTVGFINKIPHSLIQAFKSTLEEVRNADLLLHVVDLTSPVCERQVDVVEAVLEEIGAGNIPRLIVPNKIDVAGENSCRQLGKQGAYGACPISAVTGEGLDQLLERVSTVLNGNKEKVEFFFSPLQGSLLSLLRRQGRILQEQCQEERVHVTALVNTKLAGQMRKWLREDGSASG